MTYIPTTASPINSVFGRIGAIAAAPSDYDASLVDNDSGVPGAFVDDALDNIYARLPLQIDLPGLILNSFPIYTTVLTIPLEADKAYSAILFVSAANDPLTDIQSGMWRFLGSFHRNTASGAIVDGDSITSLGNFGSMSGRFLESGNNVLMQIRVRDASIVNVRIDARVFEIIPG